jgi:VIT1/CCC1 family predicted Fe2+/Mn2+ transporter
LILAGWVEKRGIMIYFLCGLLIIHGIVCLVGAFIPVYPPVFFFYAFFPGPFIIKLIIVLLAGAAQLAYGAYLSLIQKQKIRWYWPAIITVVMAGGESNRSYQRKRAVCRP